MSMGGGSAPRPPKLKTVDVGGAAGLVNQYNTGAYNASDLAYAFPGNMPGVPQTGPIPPATQFAIGQLGMESKGGISTQASDALKTAGLGAEGATIPGGSEFATAKNLGLKNLPEKEARDRNFADSFLRQNPARSIGLTGNQALDILLANTGNLNAYNQSIFQTQQNAANAATLQQGQNLTAASSLFGGLTNILGNYFNKQSPYTDPFSSFWNPPVFSADEVASLPSGGGDAGYGA